MSKEVKWVGSLLQFCSLQTARVEMVITWSKALLSFHVHHAMSHDVDSDTSWVVDFLIYHIDYI